MILAEWPMVIMGRSDHKTFVNNERLYGLDVEDLEGLESRMDMPNGLLANKMEKMRSFIDRQIDIEVEAIFKNCHYHLVIDGDEAACCGQATFLQINGERFVFPAVEEAREWLDLVIGDSEKRGSRSEHGEIYRGLVNYQVEVEKNR